MFKKPLSTLKTSAPLRSSDRRKLKQRVVSSYGISPEDGDVLVPEGILSAKFNTHLSESGTVYLSPDGDPLWFTAGKASEELIPTIYTMWKLPKLLPFISTPAAVIPVLVGGADLMIPGVVYHTPSLREGQLVSISQYTHAEKPTLSPPLAVGRMALASDKIQDGHQEKGKAVYVLHTWKDHLWDMGSKPDVPETVSFALEPQPQSADDPSSKDAESENGSPVDASLPSPGNDSPAAEEIPANTLPSTCSYTSDEISALLHASLLQALSTVLSEVPASSFPISASTFYSTYILPYRPAFPNSVLPIESDSSDPQDITIKNSGHKSLTAFLKSAEKGSLLTLKAPPKHGQQTEVVVTAVSASHPSVATHKVYVTVKDLETRAAKKAQREERLKEAEQESGHWVEIKELWKPHLRSLELFEALGGSGKTLYELTEIRTLLNNYITSKALVNPREQAYINLDSVLSDTVAAKAKKTKGTETAPAAAPVEFMKRDELTRAILEQMQSWYEVTAPGKDPVVKKGALKPIQVVVKIRQGRKASTLVTGFEPFLVLSGDEMAEDLRKICAGATSVSPRGGGVPGLEVLVQGKQSKIVFDYLTNKGIPKKWIEVSDLAGKK
ncbi:Eukaryotic translation initiation factor SUI1 family protein [Mycena sanguinolenta]|uniref:Eukaryotic translation initiation factor SUI1 family protein n=1 Tax=Mycena sanguinolenta TaxID=230812 RepID=A0A8H6WYR0_9AGAR|nr:Eukaryotic translation initiation factor SUI1 family protein [Mycena sanguinolenta]